MVFVTNLRTGRQGSTMGIDPRQSTVGAYLRRCRNAAGLTQENVYDKLGVTTKTVSDWENGREPPAFENLLRLCDLIGADIREVQRLYLGREPRVAVDVDEFQRQFAANLARDDQEVLEQLMRPVRWLAERARAPLHPPPANE